MRAAPDPSSPGLTRRSDGPVLRQESCDPTRGAIFAAQPGPMPDPRVKPGDDDERECECVDC